MIRVSVRLRLAHTHRSRTGRARQLCPGSSDVNLFSYRKGIVDLNAEVAHRALDFRVAQQDLDGAQIACSPVDERRLSAAQRVRAKQEWVETDAGDPLADQARVLARRHTLTLTASADKQMLADLLACEPDIVVNRLTGQLG